ncbi:MAG: ABC transporter ATP-binding protein [Acidimicrobiales bacterium]
MNAAQVLAFGLVKRYGSVEALASVDLALHGGLISLLGSNGAGKTTLLRCLATVVRPDAGSLLVDGLDPDHEADRIEIRSRLGYLPQEPGLSRSATAFDVVDYVAVLKGHHDDRRRRQHVFRVLERVGLADRAAARVDDLSGGMRRRLALAQALLGSPTLLLLDEPAAGLDPDERLRLREIVAELRHRTTVVMSTHLTDEAAVSDQVLVLASGRIAFVGSPERLTALAAGQAWRQVGEPFGVRASWRQADGSYRCLGHPPPGAEFVAPTLEDGYLLLQEPLAGATNRGPFR